MDASTQIRLELLKLGSVRPRTPQELIAYADELLEYVVSGSVKPTKDSAYWCDSTDPLARVHGREKCADLEEKLRAMTYLAWAAGRPDAEVARACDALGRKFPALYRDVRDALTAVDAFDGDLKQAGAK